MGVFDDEPAPRSRRGPLLGLLVVAAVAAAGGYWFMSAPRAPEPVEPRRPPAAARPRPEPPRAAEPRERPPAAASDTAERPAPDTAREEAAARPAAGGVLRVRSDVPGAAVFLDRKFLGNTPLDVDGLAPGSHRLNVSVEGYEGHAQSVEIGETPADVDVRFKEVRLNASVPVVHKHGVGSCNGRLVADTNGLRYETGKADDAFSLAFAEIETFSVDYLKKALRVKRRGGRTWNFEDPNGQADPLFVFHRDVEKARSRLTDR
jgi:hypothetical protein